MGGRVPSSGEKDIPAIAPLLCLGIDCCQLLLVTTGLWSLDTESLLFIKDCEHFANLPSLTRVLDVAACDHQAIR